MTNQEQLREGVEAAYMELTNDGWLEQDDGRIAYVLRSSVTEFYRCLLTLLDIPQAVEHCKDCCCARSWKALGITSYTGKSIPEHIAALRTQKERFAGMHGRDCPKVEHVGDIGYLHGPHDDGPYNVDGVKYCGRCHAWVGLEVTPPSREAPDSFTALRTSSKEAEPDAKAYTCPDCYHMYDTCSHCKEADDGEEITVFHGGEGVFDHLIRAEEPTIVRVGPDEKCTCKNPMTTEVQNERQKRSRGGPA